MVWARLDSGANNNAKLLALSNGAHRMFTCGLVYCQDNLTDGFIEESAIHSFGVKGSARKFAAELCRVLVPGKEPLWHKVPGGYRINDFHDWNDPAAKIRQKRAQGKARIDKFRARLNGANCNALQPALQDADSESCNALRNAFATRIHVHKVLTEQSTAPSAPSLCGKPVENRKPATPWKRMVAVVHAVMDECAQGDWSHEIKARCQQQGLPYHELKDGREMWVRAMDYVAEVRARRAQRAS